ncbi:MAG: NIPSNAP family protein [Fimbriimonadaceae bacterium]|nr:NIPSNAP family protein [Fimbriimonadaceae bacterium]
MTRRAVTTAGAAALGLSASGLAQQPDGPEFYDLRAYQVSAAQAAAWSAFLGERLAPHLARLGAGPIGLFGPRQGEGLLWLLLRHPSLESWQTLPERLLADPAVDEPVRQVLGASAEAPAYGDCTIRLLRAIAGLPRLERPASGPQRVYQLRLYESPSLLTAAKKIEMFNTAELAIFRDCGLAPVVFGETLAGPQCPCLSYLLGFNSPAEQAAAWTKFRTHPAWLELRARPEYADKRLIRRITNLDLRPLPGSEL